MTTAIDTTANPVNPFPGATRLASFEGQMALALARAFGHEWAFHADNARTFEEARAAQWRGQEDPSWPGLEPSLCHRSGSGRFRWTITPERAVIEICRPNGVALSITVESDSPDRWRTTLGPEPGLVRHAVAARWVLEALFGPERAERAFVGLLGPARARAYASVTDACAAYAATNPENGPEHWAESDRLYRLRKEVEDYRLW